MSYHVMEHGSDGLEFDGMTLKEYRQGYDTAFGLSEFDLGVSDVAATLMVEGFLAQKRGEGAEGIVPEDDRNTALTLKYLRPASAGGGGNFAPESMQQQHNVLCSNDDCDGC